MFYLILALVDPGDEVLVPEPRLPDLRVDDPLHRRRAGAGALLAEKATSSTSSS
jgi:hypothetical protein